MVVCDGMIECLYGKQDFAGNFSSGTMSYS